MSAEDGKRFITTINKRLAVKCGYIGSVVIRPNVIAAVVKANLIGQFIYPIQFYYCGSPDARLRKKFGIPDPAKDAYA